VTVTASIAKKGSHWYLVDPFLAGDRADKLPTQYRPTQFLTAETIQQRDHSHITKRLQVRRCCPRFHNAVKLGISML
jgi:hypothetical protein